MISRSLTQALSSLVEDYRDLFRQDLSEANLTDLAERVEHTLNAITVCLDARFFENPRHLPLLDDFKSALIFWLKSLGLDEHQAQAFHYRLSGEFVLALHEQWGREPTTYAILTESIQTPFTQATLNQRSRWQYNAWL